MTLQFFMATRAILIWRELICRELFSLFQIITCCVSLIDFYIYMYYACCFQRHKLQNFTFIYLNVTQLQRFKKFKENCMAHVSPTSLPYVLPLVEVWLAISNNLYYVEGSERGTKSQFVILKSHSHFWFLTFFFPIPNDQISVPVWLEPHFPRAKPANPNSHFTPSGPSLLNRSSQ